MLKITKKGDKYWLFEDSQIGLFSPSKFTINLLNNVITIVYENGLKSKNYNVIDCEIYDLGATSPFTTSSGDLFMQKLEELNCPCFQKNENIFNISGGAWGDITGNLSNQTDLQTALDSKLNKDTTAGVERAYIINADGSQDIKATSEFKDVLEFANLSSFPTTGVSGKIYLALDTNFTYRWSGSAYVQIGGGGNLVISDTNIYTHTGTTTATRLVNLLIPANTVKNNDVWEMEIVAYRTSSNFSGNCVVWGNLSVEVDNAGFIRGVPVGNVVNNRVRIIRSLFFKDGFFSRNSNSGGFYHDFQSFSSNSKIGFDNTIDNHVRAGLTLGTSTDIGVLEYVIFRKIN